MIHVASPQVSAVKIEVSEIHASKALDEVLLDDASSGNDVCLCLCFTRCRITLPRPEI